MYLKQDNPYNKEKHESKKPIQFLMKNSIYQEGGELDTPTTLWFCENLPLWEGFILGFGPAYG